MPEKQKTPTSGGEPVGVQVVRRMRERLAAVEYREIGSFEIGVQITEKKDDFGNALQNLYRELERAEDLVGPS
jgi:hypothetical protein